MARLSNDRIHLWSCITPGLLQCAQLQSPIFTPATKAETGHDENVGVDTMIASLGKDVAKQLQERSIAIYRKGADWARERGVIIADTKFEFGWCDDRIILIDEVLTPDSSRFWPMGPIPTRQGAAVL